MNYSLWSAHGGLRRKILFSCSTICLVLIILLAVQNMHIDINALSATGTLVDVNGALIAHEYYYDVATVTRLFEDDETCSRFRQSLEEFGIEATVAILFSSTYYPAFDVPRADSQQLIVRSCDLAKYVFLDDHKVLGVKEDFTSFRPFSEGLAAVGRNYSEKGTPVRNNTLDTRYGYIDGTGMLVIEPRFVSAGDFTEGLAVVATLGQTRGETLWGAIDRFGNWVVGPQFKRMYPFSDGLAAAVKEGEGKVKSGLVDIKGDFQVEFPPDWSVHSSLSEGLALVRTLAGFVFVDRDGKVAMDLRGKWDEVGPMSSGRARVRRGNRWGYIDKDGVIRIEPKFGRCTDFIGGLACVY